MTDHYQKVHPVVQDVEAPHTPTAPLVPREMTKSERGEPVTEQYPPPLRRTLPVEHTKPPKKRNCCCRCLCWTLCSLLILIVAIGITVGILYLVFRPKLPKYSVDSLKVTQFNFNGNNSLNASFDVTITARNPNKKVGIYYIGGSHISVWYADTQLCQGSLPKFYQGHHNTTVLNLPLSGDTQDASDLLSRLQAQQQQTGNIPLHLRARQPVRVKFGKLKLMKVKFLVKCKLEVDRLSANNDVRIKNSDCKFRFRF